MNWVCPPVYTSSWLTAVLWRSRTHTWKKHKVKQASTHCHTMHVYWKWGNYLVWICKCEKSIEPNIWPPTAPHVSYNWVKMKYFYLVKRALRALRRPHTASPSVSLTQRSTAALARPNSLPTEWLSSSTQSITSPCSCKEGGRIQIGECELEGAAKQMEAKMGRKSDTWHKW